MRTDDGSIVQECLNGKPGAFGILVDKYKAGIYAFVYAELLNFHDAQDVTQEVFLQAYRGLHDLRRWESFAFWLYRIARNLCKKWIRTQSRRPDNEFIEDQNPRMLEVSSLDSRPESQMSESLQEALDSLPDAYREVLMLHYFGGMTIKNIARATGASPGAIGMRLSRARVKLREEMIAMMDTAFEGQKLQASFTFRVVEAVKHIRIRPMPRVAGLSWGASLAAGIIMAVLSLNPRMSIPIDIAIPAGSPLSGETRVMETGQISVDILKVSQIPIIASDQGNGDNRGVNSLHLQNAPLLAPHGETTFANVAKEAGLGDIKRFQSMGVVWGDYDNDGDLDLYVAHSGIGPNWKMEEDVFYRNNGDGTFTDATAEAGLGENKGDARYAGSLDFDNDGYLDLYVYNPTWNGAVDNRLLLYRNNGDGTFTDVTEDAEIKGLVGVSTGTGTFADYDNDGDLDMYFIFSWRTRIFYENNGDGTFTDRTDRAGLGDEHRGFHVTSGDYDNDGDMDIYLSNGTGEGVMVPAVLYRNNGDGTFTDVAEEAGVSEDRNGRAVTFLDYDNDGDLDLLAGGAPRNRLYRNNGDGTFTDVAAEVGFILSAFHGLTAGDYDNDGYIDVFAMEWNKPRMLYHNNGDGTFTNIAADAGVKTQAMAGGGCALADYDNDGDLDLYVANLTTFDMLYRNNGNDNNWLHIKLVGTESNRDGVGARVTVKAGDLSMIREINPGYDRAQSSLTAHFGLGQNTKADSIEIRWPSGPLVKEGVGVIPARVDVLDNISANQFIVVEEGVGIIKSRPAELQESRTVEPEEKLPTKWGKVKSNKLYQNYPNPFNPETWIPFTLSEPKHVTIKIYTQTGQLIRTLDLGQKPSGTYLSKEKAAYWDGRNEAGETVASDVYFYSMEAGGNTGLKKMVLAQ